MKCLTLAATLRYIGFVMMGPLRRRSSGHAIVEVIIAALLMAIVVSGLFTVSLTLRGGTRKTTRKTQALFYARQAAERVKAYVTGDTAIAVGPGAGGNWHIAEDSCPGACGANCWALAPCQHDVSQLLPATCGVGVSICRAAPVNATLTYVITDQGGDANCGNNVNGSDGIAVNLPIPCKRAVFMLHWND